VQAIAWTCLMAGCGKEGPPLPPLRLVPAPVGEVSARRTASEVELRFVLPTRNQNGPGPVDLARVEIYAVTVAPGATPPDNREFFSKQWLVGTLEVQPPAEEGDPLPESAADPRPSPGDAARFVEKVTPEILAPAVRPEPEGRGQEPGGRGQEPRGRGQEPASGAQKPATAAAPAQATTEPAPTYPVRLYALRGVGRSGRAGPPAPRVAVPLVDPPQPPTHIEVTFTERAFSVSWFPPVLEVGAAPLAFNVYAADAPARPLNASPAAAAAFDEIRVRFDEEQCFAVRSVQTIQNIPIESAPSPPACVTARDIFPPAAPRGLTVIAAPEGISLSWDANTEADLAGYIVLRSDESGAAFQPLTPEPIRDTNYRDTTVQSGVTYVYRLVAVDKATPPNTSAQSEPERAVAR
jgi:hypothetical protein